MNSNNFVNSLLAPFLTILFIFLGLFIYTKLAGPLPLYITSVSTNKTDSFSVTGQGKASIQPDSATISVGVEVKADTAQAAQDQLNASINKVSSSIKSLGIDPSDIQTSNYNVNPTYDYTNGSQKITGYQANSNLTVKIKDLTKANSVLDSAIAAGATQAGGVNFNNTNSTQAENEARIKAVADAKAKANVAAQAAGFQLGRIINYSENFGGMPGPLPMAAGATGGMNVNQTKLELGTNEITVNVTLSYEVK